jgi:ribosomal protein S18 acetylase RimI-like enzyme
MTHGLRRLAEADLPRAAALSAAVGWNQAAADWGLFLRQGEARCLDDGGDALAGTAAVLPFGSELAWISMVIVRPDRRRQGLATALMRWAMERLATTPCVALDATPAGREVYSRLGFLERWSFARWALPDTLPMPESAPRIRPLAEADWPALLALDARGFGADRAALLKHLANRLPAAALAAENGDGHPIGFALARDGLRAPQIGPVVAETPEAAASLIAAALPAAPRAVLDLADHATALGAYLSRHGATPERPFVRMTLGAPPPGDARLLHAMAGPEFG